MASASFQQDIELLRTNCLQHATSELRNCYLIGLPLTGDGITHAIADARRAFVRLRLPSKINKRTLQAANIPATVLVLSVADELKVAKRGTVFSNLDGTETEFALLLVSNDTMAKVHGRDDQQAEQFTKFTAFCDQAELVFASYRDELSAIGVAAECWLSWLFAVAVTDPGLCSSEGNGIRTVSKLWLAAFKAIERLQVDAPQKASIPTNQVTVANPTHSSDAERLDRLCILLGTKRRQIDILRFMWRQKLSIDLRTLTDTVWRDKDVNPEAVERTIRRLNEVLATELQIHILNQRVTLEIFSKGGQTTDKK